MWIQRHKLLQHISLYRSSTVNTGQSYDDISGSTIVIHIKYTNINLTA